MIKYKNYTQKLKRGINNLVLKKNSIIMIESFV